LSAPTREVAAERGVITVDGLTRSFGETLAVCPFRVTIGPGGITGLLGPNGSGKSTFLRMLLGLVRPNGGTARIDGIPLVGDGTAIRRRVMYMPGELRPYGEMTGSAHLDWLLRGRDEEAYKRAETIALELGLPLARKVRGYSHGMKRQLFFAAAMGPKVAVRILDEPTEGLDPTRRREVLERLMEDVRTAETTILLSSHHLGEVDRACDRTLFLRRGELLDEASASKIHRRARRALRLTFPPETSVDELARAFASLSAAEEAEDFEAAEHEARATVLLREGLDARAGLRALLARTDVPEPVSLVYGELSLHELYRELYGAEGV